MTNTGWPPKHREEFVSGSLFIRQMHLPTAGHVVEGHKHKFDHTTYCVRGSVVAEVMDAQGNTLEFYTLDAKQGRNWLLIDKDKIHRITALYDDCLCHCIFSHRDRDGNLSDTFIGNTEATF